MLFLWHAYLNIGRNGSLGFFLLFYCFFDRSQSSWHLALFSGVSYWFHHLFNLYFAIVRLNLAWSLLYVVRDLSLDDGRDLFSKISGGIILSDLKLLRSSEE